MAISTSRTLLDIRSLPATREVIAYKDGGLFPVLALTPGGIIVAVVRGGAGHHGLTGRIEVIRSFDCGHTWSPPNVVADSDWDDRNPALGVSNVGALLLAYQRVGNYDAEGNSYPVLPGSSDMRSEIMVTRSFDAGLTWERPIPLPVESLRTGTPFGKIVALDDGTLLLPVYGAQGYGTRSSEVCSHLVRSHDDGESWGEPSLVAAGMNETALLVLENGDLLAVMRAEEGDAALDSARSSDGGLTWSRPQQVTGRHQHPGDLLRLANGDILLTYGNRTPPYRIEGRISRDNGHTWLDGLLIFSGALYGYAIDTPPRTDLGYPSTAICRGSGRGQGVTMYYYNPSIQSPPDWRHRAANPLYIARGYYAIAVAWSEAELIARLDAL